MDVHIDQLGRHLQHQEGDGKAADHQQAAIGFAQGVLQGPVADVPAVEKEILHPVVAAALAGMGHVAGQLHLVLDALDPNQVVGQLAAEERAIRSSQPSWAASSNIGFSLCRKVKCTCGAARAMRMNASETWPNSVTLVRRNFRRTGVLKNRFCTSTAVPTGQPQGATLAHVAAAGLDFRPAGAFRRAAPQHQPAHFGDRGQCLAAETQRADAEQIVGLGDFARGVAGQGQRQLLGRDAAAVIDHPHHFQPALRDRNVDSRGARIDGVLHQFLDHARRPFDDLAGGDFVDQGRGKEANGHETKPIEGAVLPLVLGYEIQLHDTAMMADLLAVEWTKIHNGSNLQKTEKNLSKHGPQ